MGKSSFSKEQRDFLVSKVPEFRDAQQAVVVPNFFIHLYTEWFTRWPVADEPVDHVEDDDLINDRQESERESIIKVRILSSRS